MCPPARLHPASHLPSLVLRRRLTANRGKCIKPDAGLIAATTSSIPRLALFRHETSTQPQQRHPSAIRASLLLALTGSSHRGDETVPPRATLPLHLACPLETARQPSRTTIAGDHDKPPGP